MKDVFVDWGLKPFRNLDFWQSDNRFKEFLGIKWSSYKVQGEGMYIFKEKLKNLKSDLKVWNIKVFGNVHHISEGLQKRSNELDIQEGGKKISLRKF